MTLKLFKLLLFLKGKTLHIFLCLVLILAFCFKESVPSAEALDAEEHSEITDEAVGDFEENGQSEAVTVFTEASPILSPPRTPAVWEAYTEEAKTEAQSEFETETAAEEITTEEETTTVEETTEAEETAAETTTEEIVVTTVTEEESTLPPLNSQYGQRYQEQWEIDYANQLFDLVNNEREKYGIAPLKKMDVLTAAATERAWEVSRYNSHTRPDGTSCFTVLTQYGLSLSSRAENIAYYSRTPQAAFNSLMGNYSHRDPMLNAKFEYMGVGFYCVYDDASGYHYYWTQIFYTP